MFSKKTAFIVITTIFVVAFAFIGSDRQVSKRVMSGETTLFCDLGNGYQAIERDKIKGFDSDIGWIFSNGYAKNCEDK